jgi:hypothetical protein
LKECGALGNISIDHAFVIFRWYRIEEENSRGLSVNLDAISLIKIEHHEYEMERHIQLCHICVINFWEEIASRDSTNLAKYTLISSEIHMHSMQAEEHFNECIRLQPSPSIYYRFSSFTMYTMNNKWRAEEFAERANNLENDQRTKQRELIAQLYNGDASGAGVTLNINSLIASGDVCTIVIGAEVHNLGIILEAGRHLKQVLGYDPKTMIGKNISCLVPEPFSSMHNKLLQSYLDTGKGTLMGKTRGTLALSLSLPLLSSHSH